MSDDAPTPTAPTPKWTPLGRIERRVLGVLVEKAKTTPDAYPMTLNGLTTGCNQKNNRDPVMTLESHQVETALEKLRHVQAVIEVAGSGRVSKFRHLLYEWMGVDKVEAAVMTELLLRGAQTLGELRGRAARMEPIADVQTLQPIVQNLIQKRLIISLTPAGRGQIVSHGLYLPEEMDKVRGAAEAMAAAELRNGDAASSVRAAPHPPAASPRHENSAPRSNGSSDEVAQLRREFDELKAEVTRLKTDLQDLWNSLR